MLNELNSNRWNWTSADWKRLWQSVSAACIQILFYSWTNFFIFQRIFQPFAIWLMGHNLAHSDSSAKLQMHELTSVPKGVAKDQFSKMQICILFQEINIIIWRNYQIKKRKVSRQSFSNGKRVDFREWNSRKMHCSFDLWLRIHSEKCSRKFWSEIIWLVHIYGPSVSSNLRSFLELFEQAVPHILSTFGKNHRRLFQGWTKFTKSSKNSIPLD